MWKIKRIIILCFVSLSCICGWHFLGIASAQQTAGIIQPPVMMDPYETFRNLSDQEVIKQFSETFLSFDATRCHFTNNQGLNSRGVFHDGYDFNCLPLNTPFLVTVALPLRILETGKDGLYGNYIIAMDLTKRFTFIFGHLSAIYVQEGDISSSEMPMFKTGTTGNSTGVHLHFEILKNGFPAQLDNSVYRTFRTIYKKAEKDPRVVLEQVLKLTPEEVRDQYLQYVSNDFYPLNWYKIISLAKYENVSFLRQINDMMEYPISDYYQFATYFIRQKFLTNAKARAEELKKIRTYLYAFERTQFTIDVGKEKICQSAEEDFQILNPIDYPKKKKNKSRLFNDL